MHDVLAHRISLVALHAGAMTYRTDLGAGELRSSARVVQENAHLALSELRDVLGVLRDRAPGPGAAVAVPAQPSRRWRTCRPWSARPTRRAPLSRSPAGSSRARCRTPSAGPPTGWCRRR